MGELWVVFENIAYNGAFRRERLFRDRQNPLEIYDDLELIKKFRLPRGEIHALVRMLGPGLQRATNRNNPLTPLQQVTVALRFYGKGTFQEDVADTIGLQQPSISRSIAAVSSLLCERTRDFIKFPETVEEILEMKQRFYRISGFPNIFGVVDGSFIAMKSPGGEREKLYVCRKGYHAINIQIIVDAAMKIINIVAKWPGSTNDAFVWRHCGLRAMLMNTRPNGYLLGDSGYPLEPWLMVPINEPQTAPQRRFNRCFKTTRYKVECAIGLLKSRFRCLDKSGGYLQYSPVKICKIIVSCCILHNIRRGLRLNFDEELQDVIMEPENEEGPLNREMPAHATGEMIRATVVQRFVV